MYIRRFTYKKEDVDCKLCTEYRGGKKSPHKICPYITERIEAGAVTYQEAVNAIVHPGCQMIRRLPKLMQTYSGSFWLDDRHKTPHGVLQYPHGLFSQQKHSGLLRRHVSADCQ